MAKNTLQLKKTQDKRNAIALRKMYLIFIKIYNIEIPLPKSEGGQTTSFCEDARKEDVISLCKVSLDFTIKVEESGNCGITGWTTSRSNDIISIIIIILF